MNISEFVLVKTLGDSPLNTEYFADISVTTGKLWWKKCERRRISRKYAGYWYFVDTGQFCPGFQVENLERSYRAREKNLAEVA